MHEKRKACTDCGVEKPLSDFPKRHGRLSHLFMSYCKPCKAARSRNWLARHPGYEARRYHIRVAAGTYVRPSAKARRLHNKKYRDNHREAELERDRKRAQEKSVKRRALESRQFVEYIDRWSVYSEEKGLCGICGDPVEVDAFHLDHIVPLSRGGLHERANVHVAHPVCNLSKGAKLLEEIA